MAIIPVGKNKFKQDSSDKEPILVLKEAHDLIKEVTHKRNGLELKFDPNHSYRIKKHEEEWLRNLEYLRKFIQINNRMPILYEVIDDVNIGTWYRNQKKKYHDEELSLIQVLLLDQAGATFETREEREEREWFEKFKILVEFKEYIGMLPQTKDEIDEFKIGYWYSTQLSSYKKNTLNDNQIEALCTVIPKYAITPRKDMSKINDIKSRRIWTKKFKILVKFIAENGRLPKKKECFEDVQIGTWYDHQKTFYRQNVLKSERVLALQAINALPIDV